MARVRVLVLRAPGTNCDEETAFAFELAGAETERVHIQRVIENPSVLDRFGVICFPGGFSFGDDIAAGRIYSTLIKTKLSDELRRFVERDRLILGICNGFQVLLQTGLLVEPDADTGLIPATLALNHQGRFEARWVHLRLEPGCCAFVRSAETVTLPIAHAEGRFLADREELLSKWRHDHRVVARYVDADGRVDGFPINPNGAMGDVAGLSDRTGRVFALMPHPERHVSPYQHPRWTRRSTQPAEGDGLRIFRNAVTYFAV